MLLMDNTGQRLDNTGRISIGQSEDRASVPSFPNRGMGLCKQLFPGIPHPHVPGEKSRPRLILLRFATVPTNPPAPGATTTLHEVTYHDRFKDALI